MQKFGVIYADPAWAFRSYSAKGQGRAPSAHYDDMTIEEVMAFRDRTTSLAPADFAATDCVLLLWVPGIHTDRVGDVMRAWSFEFKGSGFVWIKPTDAIGEILSEIERARLDHNIEKIVAAIKKTVTQKLSFPFGNGFGTRKNAEFCWIGTRGNPQRRDKGVHELLVVEEVVIEPRRQHSQKPDRIYGDIERLFPGPYLELFSRTNHPGWTCLGDQAGLLDNGPVDTRRLQAATVKEAPSIVTYSPPLNWHQIACECAELATSEPERNFVAVMTQRLAAGGEPTPKQAEVLSRIHSRQLQPEPA
jgi:N6-adenosine-specific RNA methylase IME4